MNRPRKGETLTAIAALALLASLFLDWYSTDAAGAENARTMGFQALGTPVSLVLCVSVALGLALAATTLLRRSPAMPVALSVLTWVYSSAAWCVLMLRVLKEPDLGLGLSAGQVTMQWPGYVGLIAATLLPVAALITLKDERTDAPESAYTPPPARPIPGSGDAGTADTIEDR